MGIGSLLGILDGLGDILGKLFSGLFSWLINTLVVPVVQAAIRVIVTVLQYFGATLFYEISKFLLALIDFVEVLFRALAGLPSTAAAGHEISMSINGKSGDLLLQMLTSSEVMQAFYATAIVGMFLLIVTTIFQMIKVEYTTEGAQNSKTGIIGKSLKSLCNMMIIPILCILGVFIGNQVLDLIDTATGGGEGSKISGTLWVAAASTALVNEDSFIKAADEKTIAEFHDANSGGLMGLGINLAIQRGFASIFNQKLEPLGEAFSGSASERDAIESAYMKGTKSFYNISEVVKNYNPFEVNYLVLIFGACIIIKCLYFTCFGLIDRLYQCVALFIVMPMVVGMSPVKDSLGSWRSKFMSKALSAYGTVISLNLFFIIVKILLNIKINFGSYYSAGGEIFNSSSGWPFPPTFMEGLIKSIMVIVGCLMIEKLAGDLGGYFGGGNAMADGKGLANDATAGLKKAASVGIGVATIGAGMAMKAGKAGLGLADRLSGGAASRGLHKAGDAVKGAGEAVGKGASWLVSRPEAGINALGKKMSTDRHGGHSGDAYYDLRKKAITDQKFADVQKDKLDEIKKTSGENSEEYKKQQEVVEAANKNAILSKNEADELENKMTGEGSTKKDQKAINKVNKQVSSKGHEARVQYYEDLAKEKEKAKENRQRKVATTKEGLRQLYENKFGAQALFNNVAPKSLQNLQKDYQTAVKEGNATPEGQAMLAALDKTKKDAAEQAYNARNKGTLAALHANQLNLALQAVNEKLIHANQENTDQLKKLAGVLEKLGEQYAKAKSDKDEGAMRTIEQRAVGVQQQMTSLNGKLEFDGIFKVQNPDTALKVDFRMDKEFMNKLQEQVKKGVKMDDIMAQISEEFKKIGLTDKDTLAKIYKALEELKGQVGGK